MHDAVPVDVHAAARSASVLNEPGVGVQCQASQTRDERYRARPRRPGRLVGGGLLSVGVVVVAALLVWQFATGHGAPEVERESVVAPGDSKSVVPNDGESVVAPSTCVPGAE